MKAFKYLLILSALILFSACHHPGFQYCDACWQTTCPGGQCGSCIKHHCEKVCESCKGYGPDCVACWECLKHDVCMIDKP